MSAVFSTLSALLTPFNLLSISFPALVASEALAFYPGSAMFKLTTSTAFVWRSLTAPNSLLIPGSPSFYITMSLACGWLGDLCLIPSQKSYFTPGGGHEGDSLWFKVGMLAFMLNHAGYIVAFLQEVRELGGTSSDTNWLLFGATFAFCVGMGDVTGMPVPWRTQAKPSQCAAESPRLPTIHNAGNDTVGKISAAGDDDDDVPSKPLANLNPSITTDTIKTQAATAVRPKIHSRMDSGVTDLSISIPATPKTSNTPTANTPLLPPVLEKSSPLLFSVPKIAVPEDMKPLIITYQIIISTMAASAAGTRGLGSARFWGAFAFMVSDVMVAWDTFGVKHNPNDDKGATLRNDEIPKRAGWKSRSLGWLLYFGGQYVLAAYGAA